MSEPAELPEFMFSCVEDWLLNVLAPTIARRLDADGEAPSRWFSQHCDPMLAVLTDAKAGPLSDCKPDAHRKYHNAVTLPCEPAPIGYWGSQAIAIA